MVGALRGWHDEEPLRGWHKEGRLITHPISHHWKPFYRAGKSNCSLAAHYLGGMVGYSLALVWRVIGLAKEILAPVLISLSWIVTLGRCGCVKLNARWVKEGIKGTLESIAETVSALIGIVCPPLAYYVDEYIITESCWDRSILCLFINPHLLPPDDQEGPILRQLANERHDAERERLQRLAELEQEQIDAAVALQQEQVDAARKADASRINIPLIRAAFSRAIEKDRNNKKPEKLLEVYALGVAELLLDKTPLDDLKLGKLVEREVAERFAKKLIEASAALNSLSRRYSKDLLMHYLTTAMSEETVIADLKNKGVDDKLPEFIGLVNGYPNLDKLYEGDPSRHNEQRDDQSCYDKFSNSLHEIANLLLREPAIKTKFIDELPLR